MVHHSVYSKGCFHCVNTYKCLPGLRGFQAVRLSVFRVKTHCVTNQDSVQLASHFLYIAKEKSVFCVHFFLKEALWLSGFESPLPILKTCQAVFKAFTFGAENILAISVAQSTFSSLLKQKDMGTNYVCIFLPPAW